MELSVERIGLLLLIAAIVCMIARRLRLPYTVGLVLAGVSLALLPIAPNVMLTKEMIFTAFLPPLIFEAAFHMDWPELRRDLLPILVLATLGIVVAVAATACGMRFLLHWAWGPALLLSVLISATDPVSVIAAFKESRLRGRLRLLVEAESLFNDGTVAVLFVVGLTVVTGNGVDGWSSTWAFVRTVAGGLACGALVGGAILLLAGRTTDPLLEITFTTIAAYGSFLIAEHFGLSGVLATLTAGIIVGNIGPLGAISDQGGVAVESFWEYAAFIANSLVFLLIGIRLTSPDLLRMALPIGVAIPVVLAGRALSVYGCCLAFRWSAWRVSGRYQHILFWGGLRGALALALALGLPVGLPQRTNVVAVAFGVVAFSVIVQGLTIMPLLRKVARDEPPEPRD